MTFIRKLMMQYLKSCFALLDEAIYGGLPFSDILNILYLFEAYTKNPFVKKDDFLALYSQKPMKELADELMLVKHYLYQNDNGEIRHWEQFLFK